MHTTLDSRIGTFLDRHDPELLLQAFRKTQGGSAHMRRIGTMARAVLRRGSAPARVLDLMSGPGDVGRTFAITYPGCSVDFVDRDPLLLALCERLNRRRAIDGRIVERDLWSSDWARDLEGGYDVIACAHGLHWLDESRLAELLTELAPLLSDGGQLLFWEPLSTSAGREAAQGPSTIADWHWFWRRIDRGLGFRYGTGVLTRVPPGRHPIDDDGLPLRQYTRMLADAGFAEVEVIQRGRRDVCMLAVRRQQQRRAA